MTKKYEINYREVNHIAAVIEVEGEDEEECIEKAQTLGGYVTHTSTYDYTELGPVAEIFPDYYDRFKELIMKDPIDEVFELHRNIKKLFIECDNRVNNWKIAEIENE